MYLKKINLKGKTALVTGAGKGIGMACAIALAEAGADLIIVSRTQKDLDKVTKIVKKFKSRCISYACDVTNYTQIKNFINKKKKIDILVNNAGTNIPEHFTKVQKKNMEYLVKLNTVATFNIAQMGALKMIKQNNVDTVVELIGGEKAIAKDICFQAIKNKKNLVTANKALIAHQGYNLARLAEENGVSIGFEASVAGGIPIISTLKKSFKGIQYKT